MADFVEKIMGCISEFLCLKINRVSQVVSGDFSAHMFQSLRHKFLFKKIFVIIPLSFLFKQIPTIIFNPTGSRSWFFTLVGLEVFPRKNPMSIISFAHFR